MWMCVCVCLRVRVGNRGTQFGIRPTLRIRPSFPYEHDDTINVVIVIIGEGGFEIGEGEEDEILLSSPLADDGEVGCAAGPARVFCGLPGPILFPPGYEIPLFLFRGDAAIANDGQGTLPHGVRPEFHASHWRAASGSGLGVA